MSHLSTESNVEQVFSRVGQLSEVNLDPDVLTDMVSIMVNKHTYKPSLKDVMDKNYEMFRGKNHSKKTDFSTIPRTRAQMRELERSWSLSEEK